MEITESAYTEDSGQIVETAKKLLSLGFCIEMDDFGTSPRFALHGSHFICSWIRCNIFLHDAFETLL